MIQSQPNEDGSESGDHVFKEQRSPKDLPFTKTPSKAPGHKKNSQIRASLEKSQLLQVPNQNADEQEVATPTDSDNEWVGEKDFEVRETEDESITIIHFASQIGALSNDNM